MTEHRVSSLSEHEAAVVNLQPGDVYRLTASINTRLHYRGDGATNPTDRTSAPIMITCAPGVWIGDDDG